MRARITELLRAGAVRGADEAAVWCGDGVALGVARHTWQTDDSLAGPAHAVEDARAVVVADAAVYYRADLRRALGSVGITPLSDSPTALIHAAWCAWGPACLDRIEGDYAFVVWDRRTRVLFCARDFGGKRPLFFARAGDASLVASVAVGLSRQPGVDARPDRAAIADAVACLWPTDGETAFAGIREVIAGGSVSLDERGTDVATRRWAPHPRPDDQLSLDDGADELASLLLRACAERFPSTGPVAVTLSGGWDSPAVFACAHQAGGDARVRAVSAGFPEGDPGREDELIASIHAHRGSRSIWMDGSRVDLLGGVMARAGVRDDLIGHPFDAWNRALMQLAATTTARVVFDGNGGDQLFSGSTVFLADLLRGGRWLALRRACRELGIRRWREFLWSVAMPAAPDVVWALAELRSPDGQLRPLEHPVPGWIDDGFIREASLVERQLAIVRRPAGQTLASHELAFVLRSAFFPRVFSYVSGLALEEGLEARSPLYDRRIVEFALRRPVEERATPRETKRLLRRAMAQLLPRGVLAPRPHRTGTVGHLLRRSVREAPAAITAALQEPLELERLGIVDGGRLRRAWSRMASHDDETTAAQLTYTLLGELWLRARRQPPAAAVSVA